MQNMPIHEVEDGLTRAMSKLQPVTVKAVKKCMKGIAIKVGCKLEKELGTLFGLMFDGWTHGGTHYVALYGVYEDDETLRVPLLGLFPLADGTQTADAHMELFKNILDMYDKTPQMVGLLVGDNYNTNQAIANKMGVPLVGCASHRFNLAKQVFSADLLADVNTLMVELRHENNLAELKKHTVLEPIKRNVTRWSSTFTMAQRYIRIRAEIKKVEAVEELIPTGGKHRKLFALFEHLKKLQNITLRLQRDDTDMAGCGICEHLKQSAMIVHTPAFESGSFFAGTAALKRFESPPPAGKKRKQREEEDYASLLFQGKVKKRKQSLDAPTYAPLAKMIPPTSNTVERLFSQCKLVLTPQRRAMLPANFEQVLFFRVNRDV
ncbi:LOW QUALITY PROTEIN: hypothetical protein PHMEG_00034881 [Phytophthora megakarya]|uniref:Uncharacterized protein n=1 Tax=Phytophthora megakarya TaxID=4795 RepID=A0A225UQF1_9STRA|nr:LOW QUALITY PROTEIN: hypothetical protein PHMEG_00034881 [Phytophthora megakarya]